MTKVCVIFATVEDVVRLDFGVFQAAANISHFDEILTQEGSPFMTSNTETSIITSNECGSA